MPSYGKLKDRTSRGRISISQKLINLLMYIFNIKNFVYSVGREGRGVAATQKDF